MGGNEEIKGKRGKGKLKREKGGGGKEEMKSFLGDMVIDLLGPGTKKGCNSWFAVFNGFMFFFNLDMYCFDFIILLWVG